MFCFRLRRFGFHLMVLLYASDYDSDYDSVASENQPFTFATIFARDLRQQYPFMHKCNSTLNTLSSIANQSGDFPLAMRLRDFTEIAEMAMSRCICQLASFPYACNLIVQLSFGIPLFWKIFWLSGYAQSIQPRTPNISLYMCKLNLQTRSLVYLPVYRFLTGTRSSVL